MAAGGARLREVGTTNRTHLADYRNAIGPDTALLMKVHASNFRLSGFVAAVAAPALADLAHRRGLALVVDEGAGLLRPPTANPRPARPANAASAAALAGHPSMAELLAAGCDLVIGSGDKLLGGPQAGLFSVVVRRGCARHLTIAPCGWAPVSAALDGPAAASRRRALPLDRLGRRPRRSTPTGALAARLGAEILPAPPMSVAARRPRSRSSAMPSPSRARLRRSRARLRRGGGRRRLGRPARRALWLDLRTVDPADDETSPAPSNAPCAMILRI
jgi:L-seryl-tRNA(Ser) seleniumtransferase